MTHAQGGVNDGAGGHGGNGSGGVGGFGGGYGVGDGNSGPGGSGEIGDGRGGTVDGIVGISATDNTSNTETEASAGKSANSSTGGLLGLGGILGLGIGTPNGFLGLGGLFGGKSNSSDTGKSAGGLRGLLGIGTPNGFLGIKGALGKMGIGKNTSPTDKYADLSSINDTVNTVDTPNKENTTESVTNSRGALESSKSSGQTNNSRGGLESSKSSDQANNSRGGLESSKSESSTESSGGGGNSSSGSNAGISDASPGVSGASPGTANAGIASEASAGGYGHETFSTSPQIDVPKSEDLEFEIRVKDAEGNIVQDWTTENVAITYDEEIDFRWNCSSKCVQTYANIPQEGFVSGFNVGDVTGNTLSSEVDVKEASRVYSVQGKDAHGNIVTAGIEVIRTDPNGTPYQRQTGTIEEVETSGTNIITTDEFIR